MFSDTLVITFIKASVVYWSCSGEFSIKYLGSRYNSAVKFTRFSVLIGPINHIKHLFSKDRLLFTLAYFSSLGLTLYFSVGVSKPLFITHLYINAEHFQLKSYLGSLVGAIVQVSDISGAYS